MSQKIGIIGCGNMTTAMIPGMVEGLDLNIYTYTPSDRRAIALAKLIGANHYSSFSDFPDTDIFFIACKPQQLDQLSCDIRSMTKNKIIISILAGTSISKLKKSFDTDYIYRIMPNTPAAVGEGIMLTSVSAQLPHDAQSLISSMLRKIGKIYKIEEKMFETYTPFSGSGPALVLYLAKCMQEKLVDLGMMEQESKEMITQLFKGSAMLMESSTIPFSDEVSRVTSKGGVTIEGIKSLESGLFSELISSSVDAMIERGNQLNLSS